MDDRQQKLFNLKDDILGNIHDWNKNLLHYHSVSNFIEHFDDIQNEDDKAWVFNSLTTYLIFCKGVTEFLELKSSNKIYKTYLDKLCDYYSKNLGFHILTDKFTDYLVFGIAFTCLFFIFNIYTAVLSIPFLVWYKRKKTLKIKQKKAYGLFY